MTPARFAWMVIQSMRRHGLNPQSYTPAEAWAWWEENKPRSAQ